MKESIIKIAIKTAIILGNCSLFTKVETEPSLELFFVFLVFEPFVFRIIYLSLKLIKNLLLLLLRHPLLLEGFESFLGILP